MTTGEDSRPISCRCAAIPAAHLRTPDTVNSSAILPRHPSVPKRMGWESEKERIGTPPSLVFTIDPRIGVVLFSKLSDL